MKKLIEYLISLGYIGNGCTSLQFSSVVENGCIVTYTKDNSRFTFGLNTKGNPPTMIFPRKYKKENNYIREFSDAEMSGYLLSNEPEIIYNELYNDSLR
jgi:hypothetical protein